MNDRTQGRARLSIAILLFVAGVCLLAVVLYFGGSMLAAPALAGVRRVVGVVAVVALALCVAAVIAAATRARKRRADEIDEAVEEPTDEDVAAEPAPEQRAAKSEQRVANSEQRVANSEHEGSKRRRIHALRASSVEGGSETLPTTLAALGDPDEDVAWAAASALAGIDHPLAYTVLLELLEDDRFPEVDVAALLARARYRDASARLVERAERASPAARRWIASLLAHHRDPAARAALERLTRDLEPAVRAAALEALEGRGVESATQQRHPQ